MPLIDSLSLPQARRVALAAQGFAGRSRTAAPGARQVNALIERLGVLQIDSVNAVVRSHYLPLYSRLGQYDPLLLQQAAWSQGRRRTLFEYWGHEASLLPLESFPLMRWRMQRARQGRGIYKGLALFGREQQPLIRQVLQAVRERGALGAGSLVQERPRNSPWWGWSAEKLALEWLFAAGDVTVAGRRGFERLYDLPERVLPAALLQRPEVDVADAQRQLVLQAARALGIATERDLRDYFRLEPADSRARIHELLEEGTLSRVEVRGWTQPAYCQQSFKLPRKVMACALLSPFDSLIWERARTERLFDFRYRLEIYTPQHKRVYGYYVLPFLYGEHIAARLDIRAERKLGRLAVHAVHLEPKGLDEEGLAALARALRDMAAWLGLGEVQLNCVSDAARRLCRHL
ncbi:winged helix-turn-helix domain-containing protein [Phytopseudomonas daroniae]|uniref:winged helix-turn-helix domain-containing protein n=1 Tax=Phytopseudomonas daroniae TaxID=2487519 RepID=UPI0010382D3A|nr:winged helix-turn-helix domain-containing protein [Pseudomonas daroniae]TBU73489.1 cytoplasmic protein [Pseudomonas daroniae]